MENKSNRNVIWAIWIDLKHQELRIDPMWDEEYNKLLTHPEVKMISIHSEWDRAWSRFMKANLDHIGMTPIISNGYKG